ncbi:MAG: hypothetical protein IJ708_14850 [Clostridia bacterium]|nr:hypothetical protein [Clostridia bacterium]
MLNLGLLRQGGRNTWHNDILYLGWSASYVEFLTDSPTVEIHFVTDTPAVCEENLGRIAVCVGNMQVPKTTLLLKEEQTTLTVETGTGIGGEQVRVRILKLSEAAFGLCGIADILLAPDAAMTTAPAPKRRIEFVGDSITCGYGVEAKASDTFRTATENPLKAYACLTAQALESDYSLVSWSGNGVLSSWVPPEAVLPLQRNLMPRQYGYRNLCMDERLGLEAVHHDFAADPVDLVVLNLGTNDASWVRKIDYREALFHDLYLGMIDEIHYYRPSTPILCVLGTLDQSLCETAHAAQRNFSQYVPGVRSEFTLLPLQLPRDGMGADGHPSLITQQKTASLLAMQIRLMMHWS